jgi:AbrB family looped-hinge helix DNA binding protein
MHREVLRPFAAGAPHQFAQTSGLAQAKGFLGGFSFLAISCRDMRTILGKCGVEMGEAMTAVRGRVSESGRLSIPAEFRKAVGLEHGGEVVVELDGREIRIRTVDGVVDRAQILTRRLIGGKPDSSVAAFLAERHREAERE